MLGDETNVKSVCCLRMLVLPQPCATKKISANSTDGVPDTDNQMQQYKSCLCTHLRIDEQLEVDQVTVVSKELHNKRRLFQQPRCRRSRPSQHHRHSWLSGRFSSALSSCRDLDGE